jgi:hypothetical protein
MAYKLTWQIPRKALRLSVSGEYSVANAREVNQLIIDMLDQNPSSAILLIDATAMKPSYGFDQIRASQTYMDHPKMKLILVASKEKLVTLSLMIIFNPGRARFQHFDDVEKANRTLQGQLQTL